MSSRVNVKVNNKTNYTLTNFDVWGGPWTSSVPPHQIAAQETVGFDLETNDRAGVVFLATDSAGNEMGFVTMSFTCPKHSSNSAEGSPNKPGVFISAGLQIYKESGTPVSIEYNVGDENLACWDSGDSNNGNIVCEETKMANLTRLLLVVNNPNSYSLDYVGNWGASWLKAPESIPAQSRRIYLLNDNDRAGIYYRAMDSSGHEQGYVTLSMTCPVRSSNSAEGSKHTPNIFLDAGLQCYEEHGTPVSFEYKIGESNKACWSNGSSDDDSIECDQTKLEGRAKVLVINDNDFDLKWKGKWDLSGGNDGWFFDPEGDIPAQSHKLLVLKTNDRSGVQYSGGETPFHLAFTCPRKTTNSAEGSPLSGLQVYKENGTPVTFSYKIGQENLACWSSGSEDDGKIVCPETRVLKYPKDQLENALLGAKFSQIAYRDESKARADLELMTPSYVLLDFFDDLATQTRGYLAYCSSAESAVLAFRGTKDFTDLNIALFKGQDHLELPELGVDIRVVKGFNLAFKSIELKIAASLGVLREKFPLYELKNLYITGHGIGGALATYSVLETFQLIDAEDYGPVANAVTKVITLGAPPSGNSFFRDYYKEKQERFSSFAYRLTNDPVANGEWTPSASKFELNFKVWDYQEVGEVCILESDLKFPEAHDIKNYIAVLEKLQDPD